MATTTTSQTEAAPESEKESPLSESSEIISQIQDLQGESESIKDILDMEKSYAAEVATIMKQFLDQIMQHNKLVLEFSYYEKSARTVTFDLQGLADKMKTENLAVQ